MNCAEARERLERLVDVELNPAAAAAVREHIAACGSCRAQHREAASLPTRVHALRSPVPPPGLVASVMRRVAPRVRPMEVWGLLVPEGLLVLVAAWYVSGFGGLAALTQRTAADVSAFLSWGAGQSDLPAPSAGDVFLLLIASLLAAVTLWHLTLLARQAPKWRT